MFDPTEYGESAASFYDQLYPNVEKGLFDTLQHLAGDGFALELGIGTGRVAIPLKSRGVNVHGVDASHSMIAEFYKHSGSQDIPVAQGDFASTNFENNYQLIYSLVSTFLLLPSLELQQQCFNNIFHHLVPGGCFVSEIYESENKFPESEHSVIPITTPGGIKQYHFSFLGTPLNVLDEMAERSGFKIAARASDWRGSPYEKGGSRHITIYKR